MMANRGPVPQIPPVDRFGDTVSGTMADVGMDAADYYAPTSIDEECDLGGSTRANYGAGYGTKRPAPLACMGQAGDTDDPAMTEY
jgi:hypothetical protein